MCLEFADTAAPNWDCIDIAHTRNYLRKAGIQFRKKDPVSVNGNLSTLSGHVVAYKGTRIEGKVEFSIRLCKNGIFVEYTDNWCDTYIKCIEEF